MTVNGCTHALQRALSVIGVLCLLGLTAPLGAEPVTVTKVAEQVTSELKQRYGTNEQLDEAVTKTYGMKLSAEKAAVARRSMRALIFNEAVPVYMAKLLVPVYRPGITPKEMTDAAMEGIAQLQVKGLARLRPAGQAAFVAHIVDMTRAISATSCKAIYLGQLNTIESGNLERAYIARLPLGKFEAISNLYREAAEAELAGYPDARGINAQQAKLAEQVYTAASVKRIRAQLSQSAIQRVNQDAASAPASEVCSLLAATLEGMLDMSEPYQAWQLTRFTQSMQ